MIKTYSLILLFLGYSTAWATDQFITLNKGECAVIGGRVLCWSYEPSYLNRPDEPPQPCDLRKDCPVTFSVPVSHYGRIHLPEEKFEAGGSITRICREFRSHGNLLFKLVQIKIQANGKKSETELAEFEHGDICKEYEFEYAGKQEAGGDAVIRETYWKSSSCPEIKRARIKRKHFKWK